MTLEILTWNLQWCRGCDGAVDPGRIIRTIREFGEFDLVCLQEVSDNFEGLAGSKGEDQFELLAAGFPDYHAICAPVVDTAAADDPSGRRRRFGNMLLSRLPVLAVFRHLLPWPYDARFADMQRGALEVVVQAGSEPLRVTTTHLGYYSSLQRGAQIEALRSLQEQAALHDADRSEPRRARGPFERIARPVSSIVCGDFNFAPQSQEYTRIQQPLTGTLPAYRDAWLLANTGRPHEPTVGLYDRAQWPEPFACDYFFVSEDLAPRVRAVRTEARTDASDHQPLMLVLGPAGEPG
jgi:endonuclease/exonuclease/phosphatase family metal-dependent hydrolase